MSTADAADPYEGDDLPPDLVARIAKRGGSATIYDIAELAGVNPSTVSRALSKPGRISQKTETKIKAAARRLNFQFNPMARALPTGRSNTFGLVVADITNPVIFGIVRGAEHAAAAAGYTLVIAESQESGEAEAEAISRLLPSVDGIVLATTRLPDDRIAGLSARKPVVLINRPVDGVPSVLPDIETGVDALVEHLASLGHRSLLYLSGPESSWISGRRWEHLLQTSLERNLAIVEVGPHAPTIEAGKAALRRVLAARSTAVIAFNDLMAIGLIQAANAAGIRVPEELSVTGFDDIFGSELIVPALTTVRAQLEKAGESAVAQLFELIDSDSAATYVESPSESPLETILVVRASTGPAPSD